MEYLNQQNIVQPYRGSLSPMMAGHQLRTGMMLSIQYENELGQHASSPEPHPQSYNGIGVLLKWSMDEMDVWLEVLCGDHIITMPLHCGGEYGTPTTVLPFF